MHSTQRRSDALRASMLFFCICGVVAYACADNPTRENHPDGSYTDTYTNKEGAPVTWKTYDADGNLKSTKTYDSNDLEDIETETTTTYEYEDDPNDDDPKKKRLKIKKIETLTWKDGTRTSSTHSELFEYHDNGETKSVVRSKPEYFDGNLNPIDPPKGAEDLSGAIHFEEDGSVSKHTDPVTNVNSLEITGNVVEIGGDALAGAVHITRDEVGTIAIVNHRLDGRVFFTEIYEAGNITEGIFQSGCPLGDKCPLESRSTAPTPESRPSSFENDETASIGGIFNTDYARQWYRAFIDEESQDGVSSQFNVVINVVDEFQSINSALDPKSKITRNFSFSDAELKAIARALGNTTPDSDEPVIDGGDVTKRFQTSDGNPVIGLDLTFTNLDGEQSTTQTDENGEATVEEGTTSTVVGGHGLIPQQLTDEEQSDDQPIVIEPDPVDGAIVFQVDFDPSPQGPVSSGTFGRLPEEPYELKIGGDSFPIVITEFQLWDGFIQLNFETDSLTISPDGETVELQDFPSDSYRPTADLEARWGDYALPSFFGSDYFGKLLTEQLENETELREWSSLLAKSYENVERDSTVHSQPSPSDEITVTVEIGKPYFGKAQKSSSNEEPLNSARVINDAKSRLQDPHFDARGSWGRDYHDQWAIRRVGFQLPGGDEPSAWPLLNKEPVSAARPCVVAVIGSGVDWTHPEFFGSMWYNEDEIPDNGKDDDNNGYVDDFAGWNFIESNDDIMDRGGHDTHVAGIIAAWSNNGYGIAGINPWARIMPIKVADFRAESNSVVISRAIHYAINNGARVINISYGGPSSPTIKAAIARAQAKGVLVVVAAGNEGDDTTSHGPANCEGAITVAATDLRDQRTGFSNWGQSVDIAAPGMDVLSLRAHNTDFLLYLADNNPDYKAGTGIVGKERSLYRASGTSFAAPIVAGTASLIFSLRPELDAEQVRRMLLMSTDDIENPGWDQYTGAGLLNAAKAVEADPDSYLFARITSVAAERKSGQLVVNVSGEALGSDLESRSLQIGFGDEPEQWRTIARSTIPVEAGSLGTIPVSNFNRRGKWVIRVLARDKNELVKEARADLNLN